MSTLSEDKKIVELKARIKQILKTDWLFQFKQELDEKKLERSKRKEEQNLLMEQYSHLDIDHMEASLGTSLKEIHFHEQEEAKAV